MPEQRADFGNWRHPEKEERYRELLSLLGLGLEERLSDPVGLLSGGQRQSLTLLMASLGQPKLLLLDEHTASLDPGPQSRFSSSPRLSSANMGSPC